MWANHTNSTQTAWVTIWPNQALLTFDSISQSHHLLWSRGPTITARVSKLTYWKINIYLYQTTLYYFIIFSLGKLLLWANIIYLNFLNTWALFFESFFVKSEKVTTLSFVASIWPTRTSDYNHSNRWRNYCGDSTFVDVCF